MKSEIPPPYNSRLQKGGALLEDMRALVRGWSDEGAAKSNRSGKAHLQKATGARAHDTLIRVFLPRFVNGNPPGAWQIIRPIEDRDAEPEVLRPLYYWVTARNDCLLYDYVSIELRAIAASGERRIRQDDTRLWIKKQLKAVGQSVWSDSVTLRVARGLLAALRDFALLEGKNTKCIAAFHLPLQSFCWIAFSLHSLGFTGSALVNHPDWKLFLLLPSHVENLFLQAHQHGFLEYHSAGRLYRISFPASSHADYANVILAR
jgi:hypothetical protein